MNYLKSGCKVLFFYYLQNKEYFYSCLRRELKTKFDIKVKKKYV
jgi:hypothetical protein